MNGICSGSGVDLDSSKARAAGASLAASRRLTLLLALLLTGCGGGGDSVSGSGAGPLFPPPSGTSTTPPSGPDTAAPSVPTALVASALSTQINLSWNASTDNVGVTGYIIYLNNAPLTTTSGTSFSHTNVTPGTTYNYRVSAYDAVPNHSAWSATPIAVTTPGSGSSGAAFFCTFATAPTNCGFTVQQKVPGRASIVGFGRDGGTALRLHTEPGDNNVAGSGDMERTDVYLATQFGAPILYHQGEEQWWSISMMFPSDFVFPTWHVYALVNFHHEGGSGANQFEFGFRKDPTSDAKPGILKFRGAAGNTSASPAVRYESAAVSSPQRNVWYDIVYHIRWSSGSDGFFDAWVNGVKLLEHRGPTLYVGEGVYLKLANYHTPVCNPFPGCSGPASSVIYDRIVRGTTPQSVSLWPLEGVLTLVNGVLTPIPGS